MVLTLSPQPNQSQHLGDAYLKLQLDRRTVAVLPIEQAQQVLVVEAKRITPIPNMPNPVLGLLNQRSRVYWVIDLPQLLGLQALDSVQQYYVAIANADNCPLGLGFQELKGIVRLSSEALQPPLENISPSLSPYLKGCIQQENEVLLILNIQAIIHANIFNRRSPGTALLKT